MIYNFTYINLDYLDDISGDDASFKSELINIFLQQVPEFIRNFYNFYKNNDFKNLAKEAHTAKSSVLIFNMEKTGKDLKKIQLLAENGNKNKIFPLILQFENDLKNASGELEKYLVKIKRAEEAKTA